MMQTVVDWLDERIDLSGIRHFIAEKGVPIHTQEVWYYLGGMTLFLFGVQVFTGILLLLYYRPSSAEAYESVEGCRSEEHTSELQSRRDLVCRLLLEKKKKREIKPP